jgi:hypothetical protein
MTPTYSAVGFVVEKSPEMLRASLRQLAAHFS